MKKKRRFIYILAGLLSMVSLKAEAYLQSLSPQSFEALYDLASRGDVSAINNARSRGLNIDSVNGRGNSGLCEAAIRGNARAFRAFLQAGASPYHPCTQNIDGFQKFMNAVVRAPMTNLDTAVLGAGAGQSMSLGTKTLIGAGVVAAGAGVAVAVSGGGGGGGGGSSACTKYKGEDGGCYEILNCQNGSKQKNASCDCSLAPGYIGTVCDIPNPCSGYYASCGAGYHAISDTCRSGETIKYRCEANACQGYEISCPKGYTPSSVDTCNRGGIITYKCFPNDCTGYSMTTCPTGYAESDYCETPTTRYVKCDNCAAGYDKWGGSGDDKCYRTLECKNGFNQKGDHCDCDAASGWTGTLCDVPISCEGYETECRQGWDEDTSVEPCYSAGEAFIKCKKHICEGNPQPECVAPTAISGEPCFSGDEELYYCDACIEGYGHWGDTGDNTCYQTLECQNGFNQKGDHCDCDEASGWTGTLCNEKVNCAAKGYYASCPGQGWHVVEGEGKTCMSGYDVWVTCEKNDCSNAYEECVFPRVDGQACYSGDDVYNYCDRCATGYDFYGTTECHKTIACVHGEQAGATCVCEDGWWGALCDAPSACPDDGYNVQGTTCPEGTSTDSEPCGAFGKNWLKCNVCDEAAGYYHFDDPNACHKELGCVHGVQKGGKCECDHGWDDGNLCEVQQVCIGYPYTVCPGNTAPAAGENTCWDTLDDGSKIAYHKCLGCKNGYAKWGTAGDDTCYETLDCGERGHQEGAECVCNNGWHSDGGWCNVKNTCSAVYHESCGDEADGYEIDPNEDSCWSGDDELYICRPVNCVEKGYSYQNSCPKEGFNDDKCKSGTTYYYKCTDCDEAGGYGHYGDSENCYQTLECKHGSSQTTNHCACVEATGWSGTLCDRCTGAIGDSGEVCYHDRLCVHGTLVGGVCSCTGNWSGETCGICKGKEVGDECVLGLECEFGCKTHDATTGLCTACYAEGEAEQDPSFCTYDRNKCTKKCWEEEHGEIKECAYGCKSGYQDEKCGYCFECATSPQPQAQYFVMESEQEPVENQNQSLTVDGNTMRGGIYSKQQAVVNGGDITVTNASGNYGIVSTAALPPKDMTEWNNPVALHKGSDDIYNSGTITITGDKSYGIWSSTLGEIDKDILFYAKEIMNTGIISMAGRSNTGINLEGDGHIINDESAEINMDVDIWYNPSDSSVYYDDSYAIYARKKNEPVGSVYRYPYAISATYDAANKIINNGKININVAYTQMNFADTGYNDQGAAAIRVERSDYANEIINNGDIDIALTSGPLVETIGYWIPGGYGIYFDGKSGDRLTNNGSITIGQADAQTNIHAGGYIAGVRLKKSAILDNYGTINVFGYGIWDEGDGAIINLHAGSIVEGLSEGNGIVKRYKSELGTDFPVERTIDSAILLSGKNTKLNIDEGAKVYGDIYDDVNNSETNIINNAGDIYGSIRAYYVARPPATPSVGYRGPEGVKVENGATGKITGNVLATEIENYGIIGGNATARNPDMTQMGSDWMTEDRLKNYEGARITGNTVGLSYNAGEVRGSAKSLVLNNTETGVIKGGIIGRTWNQMTYQCPGYSNCGFYYLQGDLRKTRVENYGLIEGDITSAKDTWIDASGNKHEQETVRPMIYNRGEIKGGTIEGTIINETQVETINWADETQTVNATTAKLSGDMRNMGALVNYGGTIDYEVNSASWVKGIGVDFLYNPLAVTIVDNQVCYGEGGKEGLKTVQTPDGEINIHVTQMKESIWAGVLSLENAGFLPEGQVYTPFETYHNVPNITNTYTHEEYDSNTHEWVTKTVKVYYSVNEGTINVISDATNALSAIFGGLYNKGTVNVTGANITGIRSEYLINEGEINVTGENATGFWLETSGQNSTYKALLNNGAITVNSSENDSSGSAVRGVYVDNANLNFGAGYDHEVNVNATNGKAYGVYINGDESKAYVLNINAKSVNNEACGVYVNGAATVDAVYVTADSDNAAAYGIYATGGATVGTNKVYAYSEPTAKLGVGVYLNGGSVLNNVGEIISRGTGSVGTMSSAGVYANASTVNNFYMSVSNYGKISGDIGVFGVNNSTINNNGLIEGFNSGTSVVLRGSTLNNYGWIGNENELYSVNAMDGSTVNNYKEITGAIHLQGSTLISDITGSNYDVSDVVATAQSHVQNVAGQLGDVNICGSTVENSGNITNLTIDWKYDYGSEGHDASGTNTGSISTLRLKNATFENSGTINTAILQYGNGNGKLTNLAGGIIRKVDASTASRQAATIINQGTIAPVENGAQNYDYIVSAAGSTTLTNEGMIKTKKSGVYLDASTFVNTSTGVVLNDTVTEEQAATNDYWLVYAVNGSTVINQGTLLFKNGSCVGADCNPANPDMEGKHYIYLDGESTFSNGGLMMSAAPLNTMSFGGGKLLLAKGGRYEAPAIEGEIGVDTSVVTTGFEDTYTLTNAVVSEDTSALTINSQSAMFDASLDGQDVVLTKKGFDEITDNSTVAAFLEENYALNNNEELYNTLKTKTNTAALTNAVEGLTGDSLKRFAFEDMTMFKDMDMDVNNALFDNTKAEFSLAGDTHPLNAEKNNNSNARWSLTGKKEDNRTYGVTMAFVRMQSQDNNKKNSRHDEMFMMGVPFGFEEGGAEFVVTPRLGYAYGKYTREGLTGSYDGKMEKRIMGVTSEARYPLYINGWKASPSVSFNAIGYHIKGHEEDKAFALDIEKQNITSMEAGVGFGLEKTWRFKKETNLKFGLNVMVYHEFLDPYALKLAMRGMDGNFEVRDEKRRREHIVLKNKFEYDMNPISIYGNLFTYIDSAYNTKADIGFKYAF